MMNLKKHTVVYFIGFLLLSSFAFAQKRIIYDDFAPKGEYSVCAWDRAELYSDPGTNSDIISSIHFSEEVMHLGREAFVRSGENSNYIWVETEDGREGWVNDKFFVTGGGNVVLLKDKAIFEKPSTPNSISRYSFESGELAILTEFANGWVKLTGKQKRKMGWVEGYDAISTEDYDIETAALIDKALANERVEDRREELRTIRDGRSFISPQMREVVDKKLDQSYRAPKKQVTYPDEGDIYVDERDYRADGEDAFSNKGRGFDEGMDRGNYDRGNYDYGRGNVTRSQQGSYITEREVIDMKTGESYIRVEETGTIQPVKAKNPKNIYYAYHKYLPKGTIVLLEVPGTGSFVPLEIIAPLKSTNKHMIGLGPEVIKAVYGETQAKNISSASISYPKY